MRLGVDFGTTNSAITYYDGHQLHTLVTDPANDNPFVMPSLIYIDRALHTTVGAQAANAYLQNETGRPVRWRNREAGEIEITVADIASGDPIEFIQTVSVLVDEAANGRLIQSIKTALFNGRYEGTRIFSKFYRIEDLIAIILRQLKQAAEREIDENCDHIVLGRPVQFSPNPLIDSRAESVLLKAAYLAGFTDVQFELEPVGVAYLYHRSSAARQTALVFDFGGGTLDLTIAEIGGSDPPDILATGGVSIGGDDLDRRIMTSLLPHFGGGDGGVLPADMSDKLLAWQTMPDLSRPRDLERIHRLKRHGHREPMVALETLISNNIGFRLFKEIEQVKKQLSAAEAATLNFEFDDIQIHETITRRRFDRMIASDLDHIRQSVHELLSSAQLSSDQIDLVLRTGGSSLIPAVREMLEDIFGTDRVVSIDPLISVAGGFAVVAHDVSGTRVHATTHELLTDLQPSAYEVDSITIGRKIQTDRDFTVSRIPPALNNLLFIRTASEDAGSNGDSSLRFCLEQRARIYVAYETNLPGMPDWLLDFASENMRLEVEDEFALIQRTMQIYGKDFEPGLVALGGNRANSEDNQALLHYIVIIRPEHH